MSEQSENRFELRRDGLGVLLFTVGAFFAVILALALASSEPLDRAEGTAVVARLWARSIGLVPAFLFSAGCAVLGARMFLAGETDAPRGTGRLAIVAISLSVMLGAFSKTAGGLVGDLSAGTIARGTNGFLGALAGILVLAIGVWVAWVKTSRTAEAAPARDGGPGSATPPDHGVSAEEAAALIPEDRPSWRDEPRMDSPVTQASSLATPEYRKDLRRRGEIPEGTRPLDTRHAHASVTPGPIELPVGIPPREDELAAAPVQHGPADPEGLLSADGSDEDLALAEDDLAIAGPDELLELETEDELTELELPEDELFEDELVGDESLADEPSKDPLLEDVLLAAEEVEEDDEEDDEEVDEIGAPEADVPEPDVASVPPPSWEQSNLFEVEEDPVDAYGTPLVETESSPELALEPEAADSEGRDVILTPVPPQKKRKKAPAPEPADERSRFLAEIGCLLVERGRVAVSMLQKQYDMDFEEATEVLDELQDLGLIGPYLGGQRRDILLTRDEWLEKVSSL